MLTDLLAPSNLITITMNFGQTDFIPSTRIKTAYICMSSESCNVHCPYHVYIYIGVGAGPAGPVLAGPLFQRFRKFAPITITTGPLQKSFPTFLSCWCMVIITDYMQ